LYYELHGNAATPIQFYMTDSVRHFFRASVYCNTIPNQDSLAPIHDYLRVDTRKIMESMIWR
jgi:gliding motility-associated lipoprotein GldD